MIKRRAPFQADQWLLIKICNLVGTGEITGIKIRDGKLYFPKGARYKREVDFSLNPNEPPKFRMNRLMKHLGRVNGEEANIIFQEYKPQKVVLSGCIAQLVSTLVPGDKLNDFTQLPK